MQEESKRHRYCRVKYLDFSTSGSYRCIMYRKHKITIWSIKVTTTIRNDPTIFGNLPTCLDDKIGKLLRFISRVASQDPTWPPGTL